MTALMVAPYGTLAVASQAQLVGAFAAFDVTVGSQAQVTFQSGLSAVTVPQHGTQQLSGYITPPASTATISGPVPPSTVISLAVGLPLQEIRKAYWTEPLRRLGPVQLQYIRQYLQPGDITNAYGPSVSDYQLLTTWAQGTGLSITETYDNRTLLGISGPAALVEQALFVDLDYAIRPNGSTFYRPDREPSLNLSAPVLWITGLTDYYSPPTPFQSAPGGNLDWADFRTSYTGCTNLHGETQALALYEACDFLDSNIQSYVSQTGLATTVQPEVNLFRVVVDSQPALDNGPTQNGGGERECEVDIEIAMGMLPNLGQLLVVEGSNPALILGAMENRAKVPVMSTSWPFGNDPNIQGILSVPANEGQSLVAASGDSGAFFADPQDYHDLDLITFAGGTVLNVVAGTYQSETAWALSGGGVLDLVPIPPYQAKLNMVANGGLSVHRTARCRRGCRGHAIHYKRWRRTLVLR